MKFEVINSTGRCMQSTEYPECVPYDMLESMAMHGYRFRVDGKIVSKNKVKSAVNASVGVVSSDADAFEVTGVDLATAPDVTSNITPKRGKAPMAIICIEDDKTFSSQSDAAKYYGISPMSISNSIKTGKAVKGHTFKRA